MKSDASDFTILVSNFATEDVKNISLCFSFPYIPTSPSPGDNTWGDDAQQHVSASSHSRERWELHHRGAGEAAWWVRVSVVPPVPQLLSPGWGLRLGTSHGQSPHTQLCPEDHSWPAHGRAVFPYLHHKQCPLCLCRGAEQCSSELMSTALTPLQFTWKLWKFSLQRRRPDGSSKKETW